VTVDLARAIFDYHWDAGRLTKETVYLVGAGRGAIREETERCMRERGLTPILFVDSNGINNQGRLIAKESEFVKKNSHRFAHGRDSIR